MKKNHLRVLHVSTADVAGGAEKAAWDLMHAYQNRGISSWMAVGQKHSSAPAIYQLPNDGLRGRSARFFLKVGWLLNPAARTSIIGAKLQGGLVYIGQLKRWRAIRKGYEDFDYPGTWKLLELPPEKPDILHCHNLHGGYFDLTALPWLSRQVPVVMTLHDTWLLSGNCAYFMSCQRWQTGCGQCPDITIYPGIRRDQSAYNWQKKKEIYKESNVFIITPSTWLMRIVERSIIAKAIIDSRIIPYGIDLSVFYQGDRKAARSELNLQQDSKILLFTANRVKSNRLKDYGTLRAAVNILAEKAADQRVLFIALGEGGKSERAGSVEVRFIPYNNNPAIVARYYQAADIFIHAARADNFPFTIIEALSCGLPVIATEVGGIPEQIQDGKTGYLTRAEDPGDMANRILQLLNDDSLRESFGKSAAEDARKRFDINLQVERYLGTYQSILEKPFFPIYK